MWVIISCYHYISEYGVTHEKQMIPYHSVRVGTLSFSSASLEGGRYVLFVEEKESPINREAEGSSACRHEGVQER